jgi:crotonobetainyl-CoA:carnitine CoA-transferase CaiB-like acyl-CoA transferase
MTNDARLPGPLAGLRVLELADEKGQFCGKLMADLGADLIKIEPPGGQNTRSVGPFLDDLPHPERSLSFWHYNTSKRGITLNLETAASQQLFRRLAATADIILETHPPGYLPSLGLGYDDLSPQNPKLIMCSLTSFGQTGPWRDYQVCDLVHLAAGGQMASSGYDPGTVANPPPIAPGGGNAWHIGGHYAYIGMMAALYYRFVSGEGQYIDASIHEACALTTEGAIAIYLSTGQVVQRHTGRHAAPDMSPAIQFPTGDGGWLNTTRSGTNLTPARLKLLADWFGQTGMAEDLGEERYQDPDVIAEENDHIVQVMKNFFNNSTLEDAFHGGQQRDFPWGAIRSMDEIVGDDHLTDRGFFTQVEHPELGRSFTYPGGAAIYNGSPWRITRRAPLIGEHNAEILQGELGLTTGEMLLLAEGGVI